MKFKISDLKTAIQNRKPKILNAEHRPNQGPRFLALGQGPCLKPLKLYTKLKPGSGTALSDY